jgi:hypothetical protein
MDITYPGFFPFTDSQVALGDNVFDLLYDPGSPSASLSVLNGWLDGQNFATSFQLADVHTQRGSIVDVSSSSANANLDYRKQVFGGFTFSSTEKFQVPLLTNEQKVYIPGANVTRFIPWTTAAVVVHWTIFWNAQNQGSSVSKVFFHIDGTVVQTEGRNVGLTSPNVAGEVRNYSTNKGYRKSRAFHGHYVSPSSSLISGGWHTFGLGIMADPAVDMTRVHARDIVVMAFKAS